LFIYATESKNGFCIVMTDGISGLSEGRLCQNETMKSKPTEGKTALQEFTRTMKALFRVPKSEVQDKPKPKSGKKTPKPQHA